MNLALNRNVLVDTFGATEGAGLRVKQAALVVAGVALLLAYEQSLVRPDDLSRVKQAFDLNGYVGLFYLTATAAAIYVG